MRKLYIKKTARGYTKSEDNVKLAIAHYLNVKYPFAPFSMSWDHLKLPIGVAVKLKKMRWAKPDFVWPDLFIAYPVKDFYGAYFEIKKDASEVWLKSGKMSQSEQIQKENNSLITLNKLGYYTDFILGTPDGIAKIDAYLKLKN
ncbi:MAG: hypothetical protein A2163_00725 [Actinobacteria bacterium RBG_13_35_12]|nr:MAG: hypothetical protein A2163_00725 [Actinobacteria bacterium RBG_13_35_12]